MKPSTKTALIVAIVLLLLGALAAGIALAGLHFQLDGFFSGSALPHTELTEKTYPVSAPFRALDIRSQSGDVRLLPAEDGQCRVVCLEDGYQTHTVEVKNGVLTVERHSKARVGLFFTGTLQDEICLYLPETAYDALTVSSASGDVEIPADFHFGSAALSSASGNLRFYAQLSGALTASAASGEITVRGVGADSLSLASSSGDVRVENVRLSGALRAKSTSGDLSLEDVQCLSSESESNSGAQRLRQVLVSGELWAKSTSGDLSLTDCDAASLTLHSNSGDISGRLLSGKSFAAGSTSGDIRVPQSSSGGRCEVSTTSGDISLTVAGS